MSIKLMTLVFDAEIPDLDYQKKGEQRKSKASTATLVLLAYADHANEFGEGAYPGYKRLLRKTKLSSQGLADTIEALRQNNLLSFDGRSRLNTNAYSINVSLLESFLKPLEKQDSSHLRNGLKPLESNHTTVNKTLIKKSQSQRLEEAKKRIEEQRAGRGDIFDLITDQGAKIQMIDDMRKRVDVATGLRLTREWDKVRGDWYGYEKTLIKREVETQQTIEMFMEWFNSDEFRKNNQRIWLKPDKIELLWGEAMRWHENGKDTKQKELVAIDSDGWGEIDYTIGN